MKPILIGFGEIAPKYLEVLRELGCDTPGVFTRNYERAVDKAKSFGIKKIYKKLDEISDIDCDFFIIMVTPENSAEVLKKVIPIKKPILIEKPITFSTDELRKIINLNRKFMTPVMVGMNRRFYSIFHSGLEYLKKRDKRIYSIMIEAPERLTDINVPKYSEIVKKYWMFSNPIHCIDLIRFFGGDAEKIETNSNPDKFTYTAIGHCDKDVEFTYVSNWKSPGSWSVTLYADNIRIMYNPLEKGIILENNDKKELVPDKEDVLFKPGFYLQVKHFIENYVRENRPVWPSSDLIDHIKTMQLVQQIYQVE